MTVVDFIDAWPVLALAGLLLLVELYYIYSAKSGKNNNSIYGSILFGIIFITLAIMFVYLLPPTTENPMYSTVLELFNRSLPV
jgi:asparagine N-glycosylation enzyme membrane subunit Stt3